MNCLEADENELGQSRFERTRLANVVPGFLNNPPLEVSMSRMLFGWVFLLCGVALTPNTIADGKLPLKVLYLGNEEERRNDFGEFLNQHFVVSAAIVHDEFDRDSVSRFDVVILDWSQREANSEDAESPLGARETWSTPTVLIGSAGHLLAAPWQIAGGSG